MMVRWTASAVPSSVCTSTLSPPSTFMRIRTRHPVVRRVSSTTRPRGTRATREPSLSVRLAGCGRTQVADGNVQDPSVKLEPVEDRELRREDAPVLDVSLLGRGEADQLDLLELMHTEGRVLVLTL